MAQRQFKSTDTALWAERFGNGSDGALTISSNTTESPIDSACTGTSGTTSLSATNASFATGQLILIHQTQGTGVGNWELNKIASYSAGTITTSYALCNTYATGAQVRVLKQHSSVTIDSSQTYTAKAWDGSVGGILAFTCNGTTTVTGTITVIGQDGADEGAGAAGGAGIGFSGGNGGQGSPDAYQGEGTVGAGSQSANANGNGGGGGQDATGAPGVSNGGGGGHLSAGETGSASGGGTAGTGGEAVGVAGLTTLFFGGGGGGSSERNGSGTLTNGGGGGGGGGIVLLIAKQITVTGSIVANGGDGGIGAGGQAAGAGAGGSILLKGQAIVLGSNLATALGSTTGADGRNGRIHADYSSTITGTTNPTIDSTLDSTLADYSGAAFFMGGVI